MTQTRLAVADYRAVGDTMKVVETMESEKTDEDGFVLILSITAVCEHAIFTIIPLTDGLKR